MINNRLDKICRYALLEVFILFMGSTLFFNHTHISDGNIIVHSHLFKANKDGRPMHNHMDYSYVLIHMLNNFIAYTTSIAIIAALFLFLSGELQAKVNQLRSSLTQGLQFHLRGPPAIMLSI